MIAPIQKIIRDKQGDKTVSLGIIGDISFHNIDHPSAGLFSLLLDVFKKTDFVVANVETVISDKDLKAISKKGISIQSRHITAKVLADIGVNAALLANNHICDYGQEGVMSTIQILEKEGICTFGTKGNECVQILKNGIKLDLYGYVTPYDNLEFLSPYGNNINTVSELKKKDGSHCVYFLHGFDELYSNPFPWRVSLLKRICETVSPTALIAGHQHVYQGFLMYKDIPICLSYGNGFMHIDYHKISNPDSMFSCYSVLHFDSIGCYQIDEYYYYSSLLGITELNMSQRNKLVQRVENGIEYAEKLRKDTTAWEEECYRNYNTHRFNNNVFLNLLFDIYRTIRLWKSFNYVHYRLTYFEYLRKKWGINFIKLWKSY